MLYISIIMLDIAHTSHLNLSVSIKHERQGKIMCTYISYSLTGQHRMSWKSWSEP